jgi:hypothetical protein
MAIEKTDLSGSLSPEQTPPVVATPPVQGQASPDGGRGKARRREPPAEKNAEEPCEEDSDRSPHRVDSLA